MRKLAGGVLALGLMFGAAACGGVDKEGTADGLIKGIEEGGIDLDDDQEACVRDSINSRSDEDLKAIDELLKDGDTESDLSAEFMADVIGCLG